MSTNRNHQNRRSLRWAAVSALLILSLFLPAAQPVAKAQGCEGEACLQAAAMATEDLARLVGYAQVGSSVSSDGTVQFDWSTGYEAGVAGFNIWVEGADGLVQLNDELILATGLGAPETQNYRYTAATDAEKFSIEHVTFEGATSRSSIFVIGEKMGEDVVEETVDWGAIRAEHDALAAARQAKEIERTNRALDVARGPAPAPDDPLIDQSAGTVGDSMVYLPMVASPGNGVEKNEIEAADLAPDARIELLVDKDGIYRVTHQDFLDAGFDLTGVTSAYLALTNQGKPVRMRVVAPRTWGPVDAGDPFIEFVGEGLDTLYTDTNVYVLQVDRSKAFRVFTNHRAPDMNESAPDYYMETYNFEPNNAYSQDAHGSDPWYIRHVLSIDSNPASMTFTFDGIDNLALNTSGAELRTTVWAILGLSHGVRVSVNGTQVFDDSFTGGVEHRFVSPLADTTLQNGSNSLSLELGGQLSGAIDLLFAESFDIAYPREFVARDDALQISGDASRFQVDDFSDSELVVYSEYRNRLWRFDNVVTEADNGKFSVNIPGWGEQANYWVATERALATPGIRAGRGASTIASGTAELLIIAHPQFIEGMQPLVAARTAQGFEVKVVNVEDVYAEFNHNIFDANAIHAYTQHAINEMGVKYILLVGGDSVDYRGYTSNPDISYIPALYRATHASNNFVSVDPLYADSDGDEVPDVALGRLPARSMQELNTLIDKILAHQDKPITKTAVFAADVDDGISYSTHSDNFIAKFPSAWTVERAYLDDLSLEDAREVLINAMNLGVSVVSYLGHSGSDRWTFLGLLNQSDLQNLTNQDNPLFVVQWGCYNTWFQSTSKSSNKLIHHFLVMSDRGAAAAMGAIALTNVSSDIILSNALTPLLAQPNVTIGDALLLAKQDVAVGRYMPDVILGWTLMGDPTMKVR